MCTKGSIHVFQRAHTRHTSERLIATLLDRVGGRHRVVCGQAARARRLFCNEIYNYNCKLTLSSRPESRSYGISINYRYNLIPMSSVRTIDHMIDSRLCQGYESYNRGRDAITIVDQRNWVNLLFQIVIGR